MPYDSSYHWLLRMDKIRALVRAEGPDVVEHHSPFFATLAGRFLERGSFRIRTAFWHGNHLDTFARPWLESRISQQATDAVIAPGWAGMRWLLRGCEAVFTASRAEFATLNLHGVNHVHCVPLGVDRSEFRPRTNAGQVRAKLNVREDERMLIAAGRLAAEKRWDVAIEAMRHLRETHKLIVIGDGPERAKLEARAASFPQQRITFLPFVKNRNEFAELLSSADAYVHACPYETFGLTVIEAVACGTPVVVPDRGGAQESGGKGACFRYRALDAEALATATASALSPGVKQHARALASAARDEKDHVLEVLSTYERLLVGHSQ